jgi:hypothetical protein
MIRISKTFTRPNASVNWWFQTPAGAEFSAYRVATYGSKISEPTNSMSNDGLVWNYSVTWESQQAFDTMMADSVIQAGIAAYEAYNASNGITDTDTTVASM